MLVTAIFSFSHNVFNKGLLQELLDKGLSIINVIIAAPLISRSILTTQEDAGVFSQTSGRSSHSGN